MNAGKAYLTVSALGLIPIALSYGVAPARSLSMLYGLELPIPNGVHIFRAIMGLYLALAGFWLYALVRPNLLRAAIWSEVVFMFGLAAGRLLSVVVDGPPHWLLLVFLGLELIFGCIGVFLLRQRTT